jgi:hypothetical protein
MNLTETHFRDVSETQNSGIQVNTLWLWNLFVCSLFNDTFSVTQIIQRQMKG